MEKLLNKYKNVLSEKDLSLLEFGITNKIPIIITGRHAPTGKSTLLHDLLKFGADAAEVWEIEEGDKQHYKKSDKNTAHILITLNENITILKRDPYSSKRYVVTENGNLRETNE